MLQTRTHQWKCTDGVVTFTITGESDKVHKARLTLSDLANVYKNVTMEEAEQRAINNTGRGALRGAVKVEPKRSPLN